MTKTSIASSYPHADENLTNSVIALLQKATTFKILKKGANEVTKALNRGNAEIVILASDTSPVEIVLHLPTLCEDKNVPYVFLPSKNALGRACGVSRDIIAVAVTASAVKDLAPQISQLRNEIERLAT